MTDQQQRQIRTYIRDSGQRASIAIGRSSHTCGLGTGTPIEVVEGCAAPTLAGRPYLKTRYRRGNFFKILYTASTLRVLVGADWVARYCG